MRAVLPEGLGSAQGRPGEQLDASACRGKRGDFCGVRERQEINNSSNNNSTR
jgi:hypothetical protein